MCPHSAQRRKCSHQPPLAKHSTQPSPLGLTAGLILRPPALCSFIAPLLLGSARTDSKLAAGRLRALAQRIRLLGKRGRDRSRSPRSPQKPSPRFNKKPHFIQDP